MVFFSSTKTTTDGVSEPQRQRSPSDEPQLLAILEVVSEGYIE